MKVEVEFNSNGMKGTIVLDCPAATRTPQILDLAIESMKARVGSIKGGSLKIISSTHPKNEKN